MATRPASLLSWERGKFTSFLLPLLISVYVVVIVLAHSSGQFPPVMAAVLLLGPVVAIGVAMRPNWVVLFFLVAPVSLWGAGQVVPTLGVLLLAAATLVGQLVTRGKLYLDWRSGFLPLALLLAIAYLYRADMSGETALVARGYWGAMAFWVLLGIVTYNSVRLRELSAHTLILALLVGLVVTTGVALSGIAGQPGIGTGVGSIGGGRLAYLGAMGFSITFAWLLLEDHQTWPGKKTMLAALMLTFLVLAIGPLVRTAWLSMALSVILIAHLVRKHRYWLLVPLALLVIVSTPVARERAWGRADITTGRAELWEILWEDHAVPALPWGNGYGYTFSLTPEQLFEAETFKIDNSVHSFVFPHNDFVYWAVDLGLVGLLAFVAFWIHLLRAFRRLVRDGDAADRRTCYLLGGVILMMLLVQLLDNSFAIATVSQPFFIVAGLIFGLRARAELEGQLRG